MKNKTILYNPVLIVFFFKLKSSTSALADLSVLLEQLFENFLKRIYKKKSQLQKRFRLALFRNFVIFSKFHRNES